MYYIGACLPMHCIYMFYVYMLVELISAQHYLCPFVWCDVMWGVLIWNDMMYGMPCHNNMVMESNRRWRFIHSDWTAIGSFHSPRLPVERCLTAQRFILLQQSKWVSHSAPTEHDQLFIMGRASNWHTLNKATGFSFCWLIFSWGMGIWVWCCELLCTVRSFGIFYCGLYEVMSRVCPVSVMSCERTQVFIAQDYDSLCAKFALLWGLGITETLFECSHLIGWLGSRKDGNPMSYSYLKYIRSTVRYFVPVR